MTIWCEKHRLTSRVIATVVVLLAHVIPVAAQSINGRVREVGGGPLISGGFITLIDGRDQTVEATFTSENGTFSLFAPQPGEYRVRLERIGYQNWTSEVYDLALDRLVTVQIEIPPEPVSLSELTVEVVSSCLDDPTQGAELAAVWEEARKALQTAVWAESREELTFSLTEYDRTLESSSLAIREVETRNRPRVRLPPFESLPIDKLVRSGYAVVTEDSSIFHAPDAKALLSPEFRNTHCFGLRREELDGTRVIGVTFTPRGIRPVIEIEGTLWIEEETAELLRVQMLYRNVPLPRGANRRLVGADLTFDRLPNGPFYVSQWWIRFPISGQVHRVGTAASADRLQAVLVGYRQTGGSVTNAFIGQREILGADLGGIAGFVYDSVSSGPLIGAVVKVRNWADAAAFLPEPETNSFAGTTDSTGVFRIVGIPDGVYAIRLDHPRLRTLGIRPVERMVVVEDGESPNLDLGVPAAGTLYPQICSGSRFGTSRGSLVGIARGASTNAPLLGVSIKAHWNVGRVAAATEEPLPVEMLEQASVETDKDGRFIFCDVPIGYRVILQADGLHPPVTVVQDAQIVWHDLEVDP
jgi:hypothetical protein